MEYAWSFKESGTYNGGFESIKEALKDATFEANHAYYENHKDEKPTRCFIGEQIDFKPKIDADDIIDRLQDSADDFSSEYSDDYLTNVTNDEKLELEKALQKAFDEWETKTKNKATFFSIEDSKEYLL
jgi:hypothetical protein